MFSVQLQRQRESCLLEVRGMEEELTSLTQHRKTLKDEVCMDRVMETDR